MTTGEASSLHRAARVAAFILLVVGGLAAIGLVVWSIYVRSTEIAHVGRAGLRSGFELAARLSTGYLAIIGAFGIAALGLAVAVYQRRTWSLLVSSLGSALAIAGVWAARTIVVRLEDPRFVKKSPWVKAATFASTVVTVYLAIVVVTALVGFLSRPKAS
ncbi:MAG: hypothetical protein HOV81_14750 [Kofleriaceae bacterium]|nr:hypothetical protein [Kofleriaceae bacterium]